MQTLNLTKVVLSVMVVTQLLSSEAFAKSKFKEVHLTNNRISLEDPYFQVKSVEVEPLTAEESLEFIADLPSPMVTTRALTLPLVPPKPVEGGGIVATTPTGPATPSTTNTDVTPTGILGNVIMIVDKLIAIGQKIIPTIEKGKAVVTNNPMSAISVLPRLDTKDPVVHEMGGWSLPVTKHYKISYKNGYGSEVVNFIYSVSYQYGGTYGGKGKYLTGITASARNITISWGFDLDASSQLIQISNIGPEGTVIAGAKIEMAYTVKNFMRTDSNFVSFFIIGDGRLLKLD